MCLPALFENPDSGSMNHHHMPTTRVVITLERKTLQGLDRWVEEGRFPNRSRAVQSALSEMLVRRKRQRLMAELAKIDPAEERAFAEEPFIGEIAWPKYR